MKDQPRDFLKVAEAAKRLGVRPETVRAWIHRGLLPYVRIGRMHLVEREALEPRRDGAASDA